MKIIFSTFIAFFILTYGAIAQAAFFAPNDQGVYSAIPLVTEPSGVVWHNRLQNFIMVSDNGVVARVDTNGTVVASSQTVNRDLEGVALVDDQSDLVYLLVEYPQQIIEFNINTLQLSPNPQAPHIWNLQGMQGDRTRGAEAVTYNSTRREFYVGSQFDGNIYVYNVDVASPGDIPVSRVIDTGIDSDLAGLSYSADTQQTYAIFDSSDIMQEYDSSDVLLNQYNSAPGVNQEGISVVAHCPANTATLVIAQDSGGMLRFDSYPVQCPVPAQVNPEPANPEPVNPVPANPEPVNPVPANPEPVDPVPANPVPPPAEPVEPRPQPLQVIPFSKTYTAATMVRGPGTMQRADYHVYDIAGEYSLIKLPRMQRAVWYRIDLDARATSLDTRYSLGITLRNELGVYAENKLVDSVNWKTYSFTVAVPANTQTELRVVSGIKFGLTRAATPREHHLRTVNIAEIKQQANQVLRMMR